MPEILAFAHDASGKLVEVPPRPMGERMPSGRSSWLAGHLLGIEGEPAAIVLYLPATDACGHGECSCVERHRDELLAALGRCNACAQPLDGHNDEDRAACAEVLAGIAEDEAAERAAEAKLDRMQEPRL